MMSSLDILREKLQKGLYVDNLYEMAEICSDLMRKENSLVFYVLQSIFYDIVMDWDERPVTTDEVNAAEHQLIGHIQKVLDIVEKKSGKDDLFVVLDDLVKRYIKFLDNRTKI